MKCYACEICGNVVEYLTQSGVPVMCCGQKMKELIPGMSDGAHEKHIPVLDINGREVKVFVGEVEHPMVEAHYIEWIVLETTKGTYRQKLTYNDRPMATFSLTDDEEIVAAYEYCNIHGFWKTL